MKTEVSSVTPGFLAGAQWPALARAWARRDYVSFRAEVERVLDPADVDAFTPWDRLARPQGGPSTRPNLKPTDMVCRLVAAADRPDSSSADRAARRALATTYMYFALLAAWELSDDHWPLQLLAFAVAHRPKGDLASSDGRSETEAPCDVSATYADSVTTAVKRLATALSFQLNCERDLFCSCPVGLERDSRGLIGVLTSGDGQLDSCFNVLQHGQGPLAELGELIYLESRYTLAYANFLNEAARTGDQLVTAFEKPTDPDDGSASRASAILAVERAEETASRAIRDLEGSVYASEVRPYLESYTRMKSGLCKPSLLVDDGEIVLLYPFGLPDVAIPPDRLVEELLAPAGSRSSAIDRLLESGLLKLPVEPRYHATSNTFAVFGSDESFGAAAGVRLVFAKHRLMVETTAETRMEGINIEVQLGSYGNHCVRIVFSTDHSTVWTDPNRDSRELEGPWTPHDIDQWVRRAGYEMGAETVWFEATDGTRARPIICHHLVELADRIVLDLQGALDDGGEAPVNDLQANVHVMIIVRRASARGQDGSVRPIHAGDALVELFGIETLMMPQRMLAPTLEDWVRYDVPKTTNLLDGMGRPGDLLVVSGDVTLLCGFQSPNWVTLQTQHILEFGATVIGPLSAWSVWLRMASRRSSETLAGAVEINDVRQLHTELVETARSLERVQRLIDFLRSAQLMRNHRDRELLAKFMAQSGVEALQASLEASIDASRAQQSYSVAESERLIDLRKKRIDAVAAWMLGILALSGLIGFLGWVGNGWSLKPVTHRWVDLTILTVALAVLVVARAEFFVRRAALSVAATIWLLTTLCLTVAVLVVARADNDWQWARDHGVDVFAGVAVCAALVLLAVSLWLLYRNRNGGDRSEVPR